MSRSHLLTAALVLGMLVSACAGGTDASPSPATSPTESQSPEATPTPTPDPTEQPTPTPTPEPTADATPTPSPVMSGPPGGFTVLPHAGADALFLDRDTCTNDRDNYEVTFPDDWWTNTAFGNGRYPACIWFSPTFYEVTDLDAVPDEIAITITWMAGDSGSFEDPIRREFVTVGGQAAVRVEYPGRYVYQVQLGPTPEEGPNLLVETSSEMGGDYELNKAVMDRMMATIEFFGSTQ
jgi:hypothetical protein